MALHAEEPEACRKDDGTAIQGRWGGQGEAFRCPGQGPGTMHKSCSGFGGVESGEEMRGRDEAGMGLRNMDEVMSGRDEDLSRGEGPRASGDPTLHPMQAIDFVCCVFVLHTICCMLLDNYSVCSLSFPICVFVSYTIDAFCVRLFAGKSLLFSCFGIVTLPEVFESVLCRPNFPS